MCGRNGYLSPTASGAHVLANGYITRAVAGARVRAERLHHPLRLGGPCLDGMTTSPLPPWVPMCGLNGYLSPTASGAHVLANGYITVAGARVRAEWLHHPRRLGGPCVDGMATSPLPPRVPMCGGNGYITPAVSEAHVWAE